MCHYLGEWWPPGEPRRWGKAPESITKYSIIYYRMVVFVRVLARCPRSTSCTSNSSVACPWGILGVSYSGTGHCRARWLLSFMPMHLGFCYRCSCLCAVAWNQRREAHPPLQPGMQTWAPLCPNLYTFRVLSLGRCLQLSKWFPHACLVSGRVDQAYLVSERIVQVRSVFFWRVRLLMGRREGMSYCGWTILAQSRTDICLLHK